jgi:hypothetical protein
MPRKPYDQAREERLLVISEKIERLLFWLLNLIVVLASADLLLKWVLKTLGH